MLRGFLTAALFCSSLLAARSVSVVAFTESAEAVKGFSPHGDVTFSAKRFRVDVPYGDGKTERNEVVVLYDSRTGRFLYELVPLSSDSDPTTLMAEFHAGTWAVYVADDEIVDFYMPGSLFVQERKNRASNLDAAASAAIADIEGRLAALKSGRLYDVFTEVPLYQAIGGEFACAQHGEAGYSPLCSFRAEKISSITRDGENWRLVVESRWAQEVVLDSKFALVSTKRIPNPTQ